MAGAVATFRNAQDLAQDTSLLSGKRRAAEDRCAAMVRHARAQLMIVGVQRFSVNEVIRLAGGSKATLAKYFGDRGGLIAAAVAEEAREAMAGLSLGPEGERPFAQALEAMLEGILRFYLKPASLAVYRAVVATAGHDPGAARAFYDHGHATVVDALAGLVSGHLGVDKAAAAGLADRIVHALRGGLHERVLLGLEPEPVDEATIAAQAERTVALVLPGLERLRDA